jgi:hypothetical protein
VRAANDLAGWGEEGSVKSVEGERGRKTHNPVEEAVEVLTHRRNDLLDLVDIVEMNFIRWWAERESKSREGQPTRRNRQANCKIRTLTHSLSPYIDAILFALQHSLPAIARLNGAEKSEEALATESGSSRDCNGSVGRRSREVLRVRAASEPKKEMRWYNLRGKAGLRTTEGRWGGLGPFAGSIAAEGGDYESSKPLWVVGQPAGRCRRQEGIREMSERRFKVERMW